MRTIAYVQGRGRGLLTILGAIVVSLLLLPVPVAATGAKEPSPEPLIAAHRGASGYAPENTMAAFVLAVKLGADLLELDVRMSKDGELVVIHDGTVDRTTSHSGAVADFTLAELHAMDAGGRFGARYKGEPIPSLEEVLDRFYGQVGLLIELKEPNLYPGIERKVAEAISRHELLRLLNRLEAGVISSSRAPQAIVQSFDASSMRTVHEWLPDFPVAVLLSDEQLPPSEAQLGRLASFTSSIHCSYRRLNASLVKQLHRRNQLVMAWTIHHKADMKRMKRLGVDGLITNNPDWE